jgi:hypothetical protein
MKLTEWNAMSSREQYRWWCDSSREAQDAWWNSTDHQIIRTGFKIESLTAIARKCLDDDEFLTVLTATYDALMAAMRSYQRPTTPTDTTAEEAT